MTIVLRRGGSMVPTSGPLAQVRSLGIKGLVEVRFVSCAGRVPAEAGLVRPARGDDGAENAVAKRC